MGLRGLRNLSSVQVEAQPRHYSFCRDFRRGKGMAGPALESVYSGYFYVDMDYIMGYADGNGFRVTEFGHRLGAGLRVWDRPSPLILTFSPEGAKAPAFTAVILVLFFDIGTNLVPGDRREAGVAVLADGHHEVCTPCPASLIGPIPDVA